MKTRITIGSSIILGLLAATMAFAQSYTQPTVPSGMLPIAMSPILGTQVMTFSDTAITATTGTPGTFTVNYDSSDRTETTFYYAVFFNSAEVDVVLGTHLEYTPSAGLTLGAKITEGTITDGFDDTDSFLYSPYQDASPNWPGEEANLCRDTRSSRPSFGKITNDANCPFNIADGTHAAVTYPIDLGNYSVTPVSGFTGTSTIRFGYLATANDYTPEDGAIASETIVVTVPDTATPTLSLPGAIGTTSDTTPSFTFFSDRAGSITVGGGCTAAPAMAVNGTNIITLNTLGFNTYTGCTVTVTNSNGPSSPLTIPSFTVQDGPSAPTVTTTGPMSNAITIFNHRITITEDTDTTWTGGTITYGGDCVSLSAVTLTQGQVGSFTLPVDIATLHTTGTQGTYNCSITVTSTATGLVSEVLNLGAMELDQLPPVITFDTDISNVAADSHTVTVSVTDDNATNLTSYKYTFVDNDPAQTSGVVNHDAACTAADISTAPTFVSGMPFTISDIDQDGKRLCIRAFDAFFNAAFAVSANPLDFDLDAPTAVNFGSVGVAAATINENRKTVGILSTVDASTGDSHTYSLVTDTTDNDANNSLFEIVNDNQLAFVTAPSVTVDTTYKLLVQTNDGRNGTFNQAMTVTVNNLSTIAGASVLVETTGIAPIVYGDSATFSFTSSIVGPITVTGTGCTVASGNAVAAANTITLTGLTDGLKSCSVTVASTDSTPIVSHPLVIAPFTVITDAISPVIQTVTEVVTPSNDATPSYTFNTDEAGTIAMTGGCTSSTPTATAGDNTITFTTLADGTYTCTITVTDAANNVSNAVTLATFVLDLTPPAAPVISPIGRPTDRTISGTAEAGSTVVLSGASCSNSPISVGNDGRFTCQVSGSLTGGASVTATATDGVGNTSASSAIATIPLDPVSIVAIVNAAGTIRGTGNPSSSVSVYASTTSNTVLCTTTVDSRGGWSCTMSPLPDTGTVVQVRTTADSSTADHSVAYPRGGGGVDSSDRTSTSSSTSSSNTSADDTVSARSATGISTDRATLRGRIIAENNWEVWFALSAADKTPSCNSSAMRQDVSGDYDEDDQFELTVKKLKSDTRYYYRACGDNGDGGVSDVQSFTTNDGKQSTARPTAIDNHARDLAELKAQITALLEQILVALLLQQA